MFSPTVSWSPMVGGTQQYSQLNFDQLMGYLICSLNEVFHAALWLYVRHQRPIMNLPTRCQKTSLRAFISWIVGMALSMMYLHVIKYI